MLHWKDDEGHSGDFQPYVLAVPISLWGRDLMKEMGYVLTNEGHHSSQARELMMDMGYVPGKGLGHTQQGKASPVTVHKKADHGRLGFS